MGIKCILKSGLMFVVRLMIVASLLKSGLEIVLIGKDTPPLVVKRTHKIVRRLQEYVYIDQDTVMRFVMNL